MNEKMKTFFENMERQGLMLTYDDVRLRTKHSDVLPHQADVRSRFSRGLALNIPIVSSPMDTVTESEMAIAMAEAGGLGIIHRALNPKEQASHVARVKKRLNARIEKPFSFREDDTLAIVLKRRTEKKIPYHTFVVIDGEGKMVGLLSRVSFRLCTDPNQKLREIMIPLNKLEMRGPDCTMEEAYSFMLENLLQPALPLLNEDRTVAGMYTPADLGRIRSFAGSNYNVDGEGHLRVGAAIGVGDALERAELLLSEKVDVLVIDTSHGDSGLVIETIRRVKHAHPHAEVVAGNVSSGESAKRLADAGCDAVKVGQGPGSICTTRVVAGVGVPQVSAVYECVRALEGFDVPVIADGGINSPGDMVIALSIGASSVMLGRLLAATEEAPGETSLYNGIQYKDYRGMGSPSAMREHASSRERYGQAGPSSVKLTAEGIEGLVPYRGYARAVLDEYVGGIRSGMGYNGAYTLVELAEVAELFRITNAGLRESHPHDIVMIGPTLGDRRSQ